VPDGLVDVLIVADAGDAHAIKVQERLQALSAHVVRWNLSDLRTTHQKAEPGGLALWVDDKWAQVGPSTTVWWHRSGSVDATGLDTEEARLAGEEGPLLLRGALLAASVRWIDDPWVIERAEHRFAQTMAARSCGIAAPATAQTNFVAGAADLRAAGDIVAKAVSSGEGIAPSVAALTDDEMNKLEGLPTFLQHLVPATADLRVVTVAGRSWVWRRLRTDGVVDWRAVDPAGNGFVRATNHRVAKASVEITAALRLTMGVHDWLETDAGPVYLETNPQGGWMFLAGADIVVPVLADHLRTPVRATAANAESGRWPRAIARFGADMLPKRWAPANDGVKAPVFTRPAWIDSVAVAVVPAAVETAKAANQAAMDTAATAETKANRLVQVGLALLTLAFAVGAYQLSFALRRSADSLLTLIPIAAALAFLSLAVFEAVEIDTVGFYRQVQAADFEGVGPVSAASVELEVEENGRRLARWSATHKLTDLMQARAWLSRGVAALVVAALVAGICRGESATSHNPASPPPTVTTTTHPAAAHRPASTAPTVTP
jgi:hypothetical protein